MALQPQVKPTIPPVPPLPPPPWSADDMQEIIDVQGRTIRLLLANYEALLRQVGSTGPPPYELEWQLQVARNFAANAPIPEGWWFNGTAGVVALNLGGTIPVTVASGAVVFAPPATVNGVSAVALREIDASVVLITP